MSSYFLQGQDIYQAADTNARVVSGTPDTLEKQIRKNLFSFYGTNGLQAIGKYRRNGLPIGTEIALPVKFPTAAGSYLYTEDVIRGRMKNSGSASTASARGCRPTFSTLLWSSTTPGTYQIVGYPDGELYINGLSIVTAATPMRYLNIVLQGAGGGGGSATTGSKGGGGGAGALEIVCLKLYPFTVDHNLTVTVGAGGYGPRGGNGNDGGNTYLAMSMGPYQSSHGVEGGRGAKCGGQGSAGGAGGTLFQTQNMGSNLFSGYLHTIYWENGLRGSNRGVTGLAAAQKSYSTYTPEGGSRILAANAGGALYQSDGGGGGAASHFGIGGGSTKAGGYSGQCGAGGGGGQKDWGTNYGGGNGGDGRIEIYY